MDRVTMRTIGETIIIKIYEDDEEPYTIRTKDINIAMQIASLYSR